MFRRVRSVSLFLLLSAGFVGAWRLGLWLLVVTMATTATTLALCDVLARRCLAYRAAVWALHAPVGEVDPDVLERVLAADLAASAAMSAEVLGAAASRTETTITDPRVRALAGERIESAQRLSYAHHLPSPPRLLATLATRAARVGAAGATATLTVAAAVTREELLLIPLPLALTTLAIAHGEARRRRTLPPVLCQEASTPPASGQLLMPEAAVAAALARLAGGHRGVLERAAFLVAEFDTDQRPLALARLRAARHLVGAGRSATLAATSAGWALSATIVAVVIEVLT